MSTATVQHDVYMTTMTPQEWAAVPDNPRQRDTERRAIKSRHLFKLEAAHLLVHMAEWAGGRCKLEGHTRAKVWADRPDIAPDQVEVRVYAVRDVEEAKRLYGHFNTSEEGETAADRLFGAMREAGLQPKSTLVRLSRFSNAVRSAHAYLCGATCASDNGAWMTQSYRSSRVYDAVDEFSREIAALDSLEFNKHKATGPVLCCYFLAYRKHGDQVNEFFARYSADAGMKDGRQRDCVQLFSDAVEDFKSVGCCGFEPFNEACRIGLACIDRWLKSPSAMLTRSPKCDPFRYLD